MSTMGHVQINITANSVGKDLKNLIQKEANRRGKSLSTYGGEILAIALNDKKAYGVPLRNAMERGGKHISVKVSNKDKTDLISWSKEVDTTLSRWCAHLLEKHLELDKSK